MKRFLICIFACFYFSSAFALMDGGVGSLSSKTNKDGRALVPYAALSMVLDEDVVYKNKCTAADGTVIPNCKAFTDEQKDLMLLKYMNTVNNNTHIKDKYMTVTDVVAVCKAGGITSKSECLRRVLNPVLTKLDSVRMVDVCKSSAKADVGGNKYCVDMFSDLNLSQMQALGLIYKYTDMKHHYVLCNPIVTKENQTELAVKTYAKDEGFYEPIHCATLDNANFYTFKFRGISNTMWDDSSRNLTKGICRLWNAKYIPITEHVPSGCLSKCNDEMLEEFGLKGRLGHMSDKSDVCEITGQSVVNTEDLKTYPGHEEMTFMFKEVQAKHDQQLEDTIRNYVELVEGIKVSSFKCQYTPQNYEDWNYKDRALRCKINDIDVDFVFDDLTEGSSWAREGGKQGLQCVMAGGKYVTGAACRGINEAKCKTIPYTNWDGDAELCVLNVEKSRQNALFLLEIGAGIVLSVVFAPGGVVMAVAAGGSVAFDLGFAGLERLETLAPAHRARDFAADVQECKIPVDATVCSVEQKSCAQKVIRENFKRLNDILEDLNDDQLKTVDELWGNVAKCLDDGEMKFAVENSDTKITDKALTAGTFVLFGAGFFFSPEKAFLKLTTKAPKLARTLSRASKIVEVTSSSLDGAKYTRIYIDKLSDDEIKKLVSGLQDSGFHISSNVDEVGAKFIATSERDIFGRWIASDNNWLRAYGHGSGIAERFDAYGQGFLKRFNYDVDANVSNMDDLLHKWGLPSDATDDIIEARYKAMMEDLNMYDTKLGDYATHNKSDLIGAVQTDYVQLKEMRKAGDYIGKLKGWKVSNLTKVKSGIEVDVYRFTSNDKTYYLKKTDQIEEIERTKRAYEILNNQSDIVHTVKIVEDDQSVLAHFIKKNGLSTEQNRYWFIMEEVPTEKTLANIIQNNSNEFKTVLDGKPITLTEQNEILRVIDKLNAGGIEHGDLMSNMFVSRGPNGKLRVDIIDYEPWSSGFKGADKRDIEEAFKELANKGMAESTKGKLDVGKNVSKQDASSAVMGSDRGVQYGNSTQKTIGFLNEGVMPSIKMDDFIADLEKEGYRIEYAGDHMGKKTYKIFADVGNDADVELAQKRLLQSASNKDKDARLAAVGMYYDPRETEWYDTYKEIATEYLLNDPDVAAVQKNWDRMSEWEKYKFTDQTNRKIRRLINEDALPVSYKRPDAGASAAYEPQRIGSYATKQIEKGTPLDYDIYHFNPNDDFESLLGNIVHENYHYSQDIGKAETPKWLLDYNIDNYTTSGSGFIGEYNVQPVEIGVKPLGRGVAEVLGKRYFGEKLENLREIGTMLQGVDDVSLQQLGEKIVEFIDTKTYQSYMNFKNSVREIKFDQNTPIKIKEYLNSFDNIDFWDKCRALTEK